MQYKFKAEIDSIENEAVKDYIKAIFTKKILVGSYVMKAFQRHFLDQENSKSDQYPYIFSHKKGQHILDFFPRFLKHEGNQIFNLEPFQQAQLYFAFGWVRKSNNFRRFRKLYIEIPRKNGKTSLCGGLAIYFLVADNEYKPEIYFAASTRDQASLGFKAALHVGKQSPLIKKGRIITKYLIENLSNNGSIKALSSEANSLEGLNVHAGITDEMHVHKSDEVINAIDQGMGARNQPMSIEITTAGSNATESSIGFTHHNYSKAVLDGSIQDDTWFAIIYSLDKKDLKNWNDPKIWHKANPGLGTIKKFDYMQAMFDRASGMPKFKPTFIIKELNIWMQNEQEWLPVETFNHGNKDITLDQMKGKNCIIGLDLASRSDISSLAYIFPPDDMQLDNSEIIWEHFVPVEDVPRRSKLDRVPYDLWVETGDLKITPGNVTDYDIIQERIIWANSEFNLLAMAYDPYQAHQMAINLENKHGITLIEVTQVMSRMGPPTSKLERALVGNTISHPDDPCAKWMFGNIMIIRDTNNNIKFDKKRSKEKIDCWPATVNAVYGLMTDDIQELAFVLPPAPTQLINW